MSRLEAVPEFLGQPGELELHRYNADDPHALFAVFRYSDLREINEQLQAIEIPGGRAARVVIQNPKYEEPYARTVTRADMNVGVQGPERNLVYTHVETLADAVELATRNWGAGTDKENIVGASVLAEGADAQQVLFDPKRHIPFRQVDRGTRLSMTLAGNRNDGRIGDPVFGAMQDIIQQMERNGIAFTRRYAVGTSGVTRYRVSKHGASVEADVPFKRQFAGGSFDVATFSPTTRQEVNMPSWLLKGMNQAIRQNDIPVRGRFYLPK